VSSPAGTSRRAAQATALVFALNGFAMATWLSRLPATRNRLGVDSAALGLALLMTGLGSLTLMPLTGKLCARYGSRSVILATALPSCLVLLALAYVPNVYALGAGLFFLGATYGSWDVSMNVQGAYGDRLVGRDIMPRYHACWSVGAIVGAGLGALAAKVGLGLPAHFALAVAAILAGLASALPSFLPDRQTDEEARTGEPRRAARGRLFTRTLVLIGVLTLCGTCIEGAAGDWIALYLTDGRGTTQSVAAGGFAVFSVAMATSRFVGTPLIAAIGRANAIRIAGVVTGVGIVAAVTLPTVAGAMFGALLWGLGDALVFPAAMSAGGEAPGRPADGIAAVSTIGYGGFLLGPPLIGIVAKHGGLGHALLLLVVMAAGIVVLSPAVRSRVGGPYPLTAIDTG
jgi:MFS family permease